MWKVLFQSVRGTSHEASGQPCQDACLARLRTLSQGPAPLPACADGAGGPPPAALGPRLACHGIARLALADLDEGLTVPAIDRDTVLSWHLRLRGDLLE